MRKTLRTTLFAAALLLALPCGASIVAAAEPMPAETPVTDGAEPSRSGGKARREMPSEMILCRGPRGAVYARDAAEGCRYARLTPENLVDFGAGAGCILRRASQKKDAKDAARPTTCGDLCAAEKDGLTCVVGLRKTGAGGWETFPANESFPPDDEAFRSAIAVCCEG